MKTYQYILLDWDGNLAKTLDIWLDACRVALEKRDIHLSDLQIATSFGAPVEYFTKWGVTDIEAALNDMDTEAVKRLPDVELYPDALEVLETLKNSGKKLALITASLRQNVIIQLNKYDMSHYFDAIVTYEDCEHHKPHPEPLEKALMMLEGTKEDAIMIGDSDKDMGAGQNAGVDTILFYPPEHAKFHTLDELKKHNPTYIVSDFRDVVRIVS